MTKSLNSLVKAIGDLAKEIKRYNDANEPQTVNISRGEAEFGVARYGESDFEREGREFLKSLEKPQSTIGSRRKKSNKKAGSSSENRPVRG